MHQVIHVAGQQVEQNVENGIVMIYHHQNLKLIAMLVIKILQLLVNIIMEIVIIKD